MMDRLAGEFSTRLTNRGNSVKKKEDTHRMADANKAFCALQMVARRSWAFGLWFLSKTKDQRPKTKVQN